MSKVISFYLNEDDPYEQELFAMSRLLGRGHLKLWFLKQARRTLGNKGAQAMASRLKDDLTGNLEDGHKRHQKGSKPIHKPAQSEPMGKQTSEPLSAPQEPKDPLRKSTATDEQGSMFL